MWKENGYTMVAAPDNHRNKRGCIRLSILIAEKVLGKPLPIKAVIHHVNGDKGDDSHGNHVICENQAYHYFLHERMKAKEATGDVHNRRCKLCKKWDDLRKLKKTGESWVHPNCDREYHRDYYLHNRDKFLIRAHEQRQRSKSNG